jgi:RNA polymerase sigma-70 factor, ECF subfamily
MSEKKEKAVEFRQVYEQYCRLLFSIASHCLASTEEAEEVVQEAFLRYAKVSGEGGEIRSPKYWLTRTTVHLCIDRQRGGKRQERYLRLKPQTRTGPFTTMGKKIEMSDHVRAILSQLDPRERSLLALKYIDDLGYPEIAEMLGMPEGTVKSTIARIAERFRKQPV